ncbi:unnamed protein product [Darwinula stevensoni]|uniref:TGF-beta family profile domain-containing protein n=1 Tax=Darwinula stevensoni TaxID=69355 RepID=A0A7R8X3P0_9CRUS|nr:unnamed protein product [Darwinula stevensoni]CAG0882749.1 unnamed protein product [Darwinula stevensoni]
MVTVTVILAILPVLGAGRAFGLFFPPHFLDEHFSTLQVPDFSNFNSTVEEVEAVKAEFRALYPSLQDFSLPTLWNFHVSRGNSKQRHGHHMEVDFNLQEKAREAGKDIGELDIRLANLKVRIESHSQSSFLSVFKTTLGRTEHVTTSRIESGQHGFDLTPTFEGSSQNASGSLFLFCRHCEVLEADFGILVAQKEYVRSKVKRSTSSKECKCCRTSMLISFHKMKKFHFIISPREFDAFRCGGTCPYGHNPANQHAMFQYERHEYEVGMGVDPIPLPSCAPTKLSDQHYFYIDDQGKFYRGMWRDAIVQECACS